VKRREILKGLAVSAAAAAASAVSSAAASASSVASAAVRRVRRSYAPQPGAAADLEADYIVVGSGAGGGTVAARLAEAGYSVLVLEAGGAPRTPYYDVPAFHPFATEDESMRWDFYVHHFETEAKERDDPNYDRRERGFWYPRAGTLGGCTAHNALILAYPHHADWDELADLTGDASWRADNMRQYFERLENCQYRPLERLKHAFGLNPSRHGFAGWLRTEKGQPGNVIGDERIRKLIARSVDNVLKEFHLPSASRLESLGDPNDWRVVTDGALGARVTPLTTDHHQRVGTRERLQQVADSPRRLLRIELHALATRILLDDQLRATGVEYMKGERLYQAHAQPNPAPAKTRRATARREVIISGGAFNSPQLLMLSGIGPPDVLQKVGIAVRIPLHNVGKNLQDRYEVGVVNRLPQPWDMLKGATFTTSDPQYARWKAERKGIYTTNGAVLCVTARSTAGQPSPDLFCYAVLTDFRGYQHGYSERIRRSLDCLTWVVLKGHTNNVAGEVTLASDNPRARPNVHFKYFEDGSAGYEQDLDALVAGVRLVRRMSAGLSTDLQMREELPGQACQSEDELRSFARGHAWGHHASCTCKIGPRHLGGVLASDFKVHGAQGLRVVDASVFPRIPGLFIASAVYMVAEKAAEAILADARAAKH
jgi:choline dehydrogenase